MNYLNTFTGRRFYPLRPDKEPANIIDIAHSLSMITRFGGHLSEFYSVAQHSCHIHDLMPKRLKLYGLLHDASEFVVGDLVFPIKRLPAIYKVYKPLERKIESSIFRQYGVKVIGADRKFLKLKENRLSENEKQFFYNHEGSKSKKFKPLPGVKLESWSQSQAFGQFLLRYYNLTGDKIVLQYIEISEGL